MTFKTTVRDSKGQPIAGALVGANDEITGQSFLRSTDGGGYADVALIGVPVGHRCTLFVLKDGFVQHVDGDAYVTTAEDQILTIELTPSFKRPARPAVLLVPRGPLPPFDRDTTDPNTGAALPVSHALNGTIPPFTDDSYLRANLWGVTDPDAPWIEGGNTGASQTRLMTYLWDRYDRAQQDRWLRLYAARGLRHFWRSPSDAMKGPSQQTLQAYVDDTKRVQDAGLIPCHLLRSKYYDGADAQHPAVVYPLIDALLQIHGIPWACHAWEMSLFYTPEEARVIIDTDARTYPQIRWCVHLQDAYADFGPNGPTHGPTFWHANLAVGVKTLLYQFTPTWSAGMMQARGNDLSVRLIAGGLWGLPETVTWIPFETIATQQFNNATDGDGRLADEDQGDLKGYQTLCTPGPLAPGGFGNGARMPNGSVI